MPAFAGIFILFCTRQIFFSNTVILYPCIHVRNQAIQMGYYAACHAPMSNIHHYHNYPGITFYSMPGCNRENSMPRNLHHLIYWQSVIHLNQIRNHISFLFTPFESDSAHNCAGDEHYRT